MAVEDAAPDPAEDAEFRRLRWRCRRGMRELDRLCERYLERRWRQAPTGERAVFLRLLDTEDDRLWRWFLGHETPEDADLARLVDAIGRLPP